MKKKVDSLGRIGIPKHIRKDMELSENSFVFMDYDPERKLLTLKKETNTCAVCGNSNNLFQINHLFLCTSCITKLKQTFDFL